jgi:hypothetical protein
MLYADDYSVCSNPSHILEMRKNPKLWVLVRVPVLGKAGSVRVLCLPSKFKFQFLETVGSIRVLRNCYAIKLLAQLHFIVVALVTFRL